MRAIILGFVLAIAGLAAASPVFDDVRVASACSCPDCDAFRDSPVVVRGTFVGWDYQRDAAGEPIERVVDVPQYSKPEYMPRARPITMTLDVTSVFKGSVQSPVVVVEVLYDRYLRAEGTPPFPGFVWPAEAGICFGIGSDPTGEDLMIALEPAEKPGQYRIVALPFRYDDGTGRWFAERFPSLGAPYPPSAGNSAPYIRENGTPVWTFGALLMVAGGTCGWIASRRRPPR